MAITNDNVLKIAHLARLDVEEQKIPQYAKELSSIIEFVEQMNQIDTDNIMPMAHPLHETQRLRIDAVTEKDQRELFQSIAPLVEAGLYLVPKVIE